MLNIPVILIYSPPDSRRSPRPHSPLHDLGIEGRPVLIPNWYPHFLDQSYAPGLLTTGFSTPTCHSWRRHTGTDSCCSFQRMELLTIIHFYQYRNHAHNITTLVVFCTCWWPQFAWQRAVFCAVHCWRSAAVHRAADGAVVPAALTPWRLPARSQYHAGSTAPSATQ